MKKVQSFNEPSMGDVVSSRKPFGLESKQQFDKDGDVILRNSSGIGKVRKRRLQAGFDLLDKWKVIVSKVTFEHAGVPDKEGQMRVLSVIQKLPPNSACTESYLVVGAFDSEEKADNLISYLNTRFARYLLMQRIASMNMSKGSYAFLPIQDFSKPWTDEELYEKYNLTDSEINAITTSIKPMPVGGEK